MKNEPELSERTASLVELRVAALEKRVNELEAARPERIDHRMWQIPLRSQEERLDRIEKRQRHFKEKTTDDVLMGIVNFFKIAGIVVSAVLMFFIFLIGK